MRLFVRESMVPTIGEREHFSPRDPRARFGCVPTWLYREAGERERERKIGDHSLFGKEKLFRIPALSA